MKNALAKEKAAFDYLNKKLGDIRAEPFVEPKGCDAGFPDFGFTICHNNSWHDIHIEYKLNKSAQMGSMRDWRFDSQRFYTPDKDNSTKQTLIELINGTDEALYNGHRLLKDFRSVFGSDICQIESGMLTHIKDMGQRRRLLQQFSALTETNMLARISHASLGDKVLQHYKAKFNAEKRQTAETQGLLLMVGFDLYMIDGTIHPTFADVFGGVPPLLDQLEAKLEVRIQPRGLRSSSAPRIDTMASFRLAGALTQGLNVR